MEEAGELQSLIAAVVDSDAAAVDACYDRYKAILTKYQEQPQLLDGCLEGIVQPLASLLRRAALSSTAADTSRVQGVCRMLHVLVSVRGHKTVVRFFPHEAADLERVLQVLGFVGEARGASAAPGRAPPPPASLWEAQAVLLLWLSILVLIPFDLVILDSEVTGEAEQAAAATAGYGPLAGRIVALCEGFLQHPGAVREMAALLLARLLTRPDMRAALSRFFDWQQLALASASGPSAVFLLPGVLQALALVFKLGRREQLLPLAPRVWGQLSGLLADEAGGSSSSGGGGLSGNALARKLAVKLAQRVGLVLLPPQLGSWRYVRAAADLGANLRGAPAAAAAAGAPAQDEQQRRQEEQGGEQQQEGEEQALAEVPEEIEEVLGALLGGCSDRDTVVRWSAAKGVGRLAGALPRELAGEVVDGVLGLLSPSEPDTSWHGGCLAIAELARRGVLPAARLPAVAPLLQQALEYDVRRGPHSVGSHVRDAAAYVCWALARAYEPAALAGCVAALSGSLLVAACYDREVNCRRAAASAFQECVGRLGSFPHGLEILAAADCASVGTAASAYLRVAPFVASFPEYTRPLLEHLLGAKLRHWDRALRALAAMGVAALAPAAGGALAEREALPRLCALATSEVLEARAGAVLGAAELLPALAPVLAAEQRARQGEGGAGAAGDDGPGQPVALEPGAAAAVVGVLGALEAAGLYRGKGGELMREAAARLVEQLAAAAGGFEAPPLCRLAPGGRRRAEQALGHEQPADGGGGSGGRATPGSCSAGEDEDGAAGSVSSDDERGDDGDAPRQARQGGQQQQQQHRRRPRLQLPLTADYHAAALRLVRDCLSQSHNGIQAAGVAALRAHAHAFQSRDEERLQLLELVQHCCGRLRDRNVPSPLRRGAAAALGVLPAALAAPQAEQLLVLLAEASRAPLDHAAGFDIELRIACVTSLAQLALELLSAPPAATAAAGEGAVPALPLAAAAGVVGPALLAALEDYSRDNRGDVGSWVREAAMDGLAQLVLALGGMLQPQQQQQQDGGEAEAMLAQGVAGLHLEAEQQQQQQGRWAPSALGRLHRRLALLAVSGLLRQALERIARMREAALIHLRELLGQPATAAAVPGAAGVAAALPADAVELAGVASLACVERLAALLPLRWYRLPLLEGLVASIGGVDAALSKAASAALLAQLEERREGGGDRDQQAWAALRGDVAGLLLLLWQREAGSARLSLPLIRTAALLITHANMADVPADVPVAAPPAPAPGSCQPEPPAATADASAAKLPADAGAQLPATFAGGALALLKQEMRGCADVGKLLDGASLLAQLACVPACSASAIQSIMVLLVNRYPKVRRHMAEQLYLQVLAVQAEGPEGGDCCGEGVGQQQQGRRSVFAAAPPEDLDAALDVLLVSAWDGPLEEARAAREQLASCLRVEIKTRRVARACADGRGPGAAAALRGSAIEHESYQSLLDDAARGGGY